MKTMLLGTTAMLGVGLVVTPVAAAEPIKLTVGGFFKSAYMINIDDDHGEPGELGYNHSIDGFFSDAEIFFAGSTVLDNGLEVGARVELEGETDEDQIDEAWIWFSGGFGEFRVGSEDEALANACIMPPGGTGNFSAFSPNQWGANGQELAGFGVGFSSNSVCTGVDANSDAQKIVYISPDFGGFQLTLSYTPNESAETHSFFGGPHLGMTPHLSTQSRHNVSAYGTYQYEGDGWGLTAGLGGSWEGHAEEGGLDVEVKEQDYYQAGLNLSFGSFSLGVVGAYFSDIFSTRADDFGQDISAWVVGGGAAYQIDAWTFGLQYSHQDRDVDFLGDGLFAGGCCRSFNVRQDRVVATAMYALGPGITLDAELGYTWLDTDPEIEDIGLQGLGGGTVTEGADDYGAFEIGLGTAISF